jgi:hypothetical protein
VTPREEDPDDVDDVDDGQQDGQEDVEESPLFAPPSDDDYRHVRFFKALRDLPGAFAEPSTGTQHWLTRPLSAFSVHFSDGDRRTGGVDPVTFTERVLRAARLNRWVSNSGVGNVLPPNVLATLPASLVVHFTVASGEDSRRLGPYEGYPNVLGSRAVTRLLALAAEDEALRDAVHPLGKRAVQALLGTYDDSMRAKVTIEWLNRDGLYAQLTPKSAERGAEALDYVPPLIRQEPIPVSGFLDRPNKEHGLVKLSPLRGSPMLLHYEPEQEERIRNAWGRYIIGEMVVEEPENPSLPRAPSRVRHLQRIYRVVETRKELEDHQS